MLLVVGSRGVWLAGGVALAAVPAHAQDVASSVKHSPRCHSHVTAEMQRQQREAEAFSASSLKAELRRPGLTEVSLPEEDVGPGYQLPGAVLKGPDGVETVVTGHSETPSDEIAPAIFVEDKEHALFLVEPEPKLVVEKSYLICGCGPPGSGEYEPRSFGARIPAGRSFKGHLSVAYQGKRVAINWTDLMPDGVPCAKPP